MGFHTHPTATEGKTYQSVLSAAQSTHAHTYKNMHVYRSAHSRSLPHAIEHMCKHLVFICTSSGTLLTCHRNTFSLPRRGWMQALEESLG